MPLIDEGKKAPAFTLKDQDGKTHKLSEYAGHPVVLYFYPKDDTPGCTKEACSFRDGWSEFRKKKIAVLGVSADDERKHKTFAEKYDLPFPLLADTDHKILNAYGTWGEKSLYGRKYMGIYRVTYVIDEKGKIAAVWPKVKPEGHAEEILAGIAKT
jgi:peroxiredoxin Q/BCP